MNFIRSFRKSQNIISREANRGRLGDRSGRPRPIWLLGFEGLSIFGNMRLIGKAEPLPMPEKESEMDSRIERRPGPDRYFDPDPKQQSIAREMI